MLAASPGCWQALAQGGGRDSAAQTFLSAAASGRKHPAQRPTESAGGSVARGDRLGPVRWGAPLEFLGTLKAP